MNTRSLYFELLTALATLTLGAVLLFNQLPGAGLIAVGSLLLLFTGSLWLANRPKATAKEKALGTGDLQCS